MSGPTTGRAAAEGPSRPSWRRWEGVARLLLPPVLAAMAVGVHWWINVPEHVRESPHDQGVKKRSKDKAKRAARDRRSRQAQRDDARSAEELERDWARLGQTAFDDEPTRTAWARRHQAIINRAVVVARRAAFEGAPEQPRVVLSETTCRTVRCRFELRSGDAKALELLTAELGRLEAEGEPVWRSYEVEPVATPTDEEAAAAKAEPAQPATTERAVRITVAFQSDETNTRELEIPTEDDEAEAVDDEAADDEAGGDPDDDEPSEPAGRKGA